jgi:GTP-binding protein
MFVDQADIEVFGGDGGRGCVSFRKEKYVPQGGPDGGDGGDGGSVFLEATSGVDTLLDMVGRHHWKAQPGDPGLGKKKAGADGRDLVIRVPPGTLAYDSTSGLLIADLKEPGARVCVARGGKGGRGNVHFVTPVRQAPDFAEPGRKGQIRGLHLELRLIADVGVVGLPNAGKSTLLSRLSHARPKIADYPFTTLVPQLGIAELDAERRLVVADIPGLIEGAHEGAGLGLDFLRHIERTRVLVHIVDVMPIDGSDPVKAYKQIRKELEAYSPKLAAKPEILAANKMDLAGASEALADLRQALRGKQIFAISAVTGTGLRPLLEALWQQVKNAPEAAPLVEERPYVPPEKPKVRSEEEMFEYVEAEADEGDWEPVDEEGGAIEPEKEDRFINAQGDPVPPPLGANDKKKGDKAKRTMIAPQAPEPEYTPSGRKKKGRQTAKQRKTAHESRVQKRKATTADAAPLPPVPEPTPAPVEADAELAAEIEAIKADDARKGKYYNRRKTDV